MLGAQHDGLDLAYVKHVHLAQERLAQSAPIGVESQRVGLQQPQSVESAGIRLHTMMASRNPPKIWSPSHGLQLAGTDYFDVPAGSLLKAAVLAHTTPTRVHEQQAVRSRASTGRGSTADSDDSRASRTTLPSSSGASSPCAVSDDDYLPLAMGDNSFMEPGRQQPQARSVQYHSKTSQQPQSKTTLMMRNLPRVYSRPMVLDLLDTEGFNGAYDFIYLPIDFLSSASFGYAFINFVSSQEAERFQGHFQKFNNWAVASDKICDIAWCETHQGLPAHIDRYRSSPVMHEDMPDECKPAMFSGGVRVAFPKPLKKIRAPRISLRPARQSKLNAMNKN